VEGGVGIEKNLNVGGNIGVTGNVTAGGNIGISGNLTVTGTTIFNNSISLNGNLRFRDNDHLYLGTSDDLDLYHDGSNSYIDDKGTGSLYVRGNAGVYIQKYTGESMIDANADGAVSLYFNNSAKLSTTNTGISITGEISATGDIIAFASDERLKENIQPLENALSKIMQLSGFTYNFNEIGQSLGFDGKITYVGVSAQEVQSVLPEAVKPAPADSNYITGRELVEIAAINLHAKNKISSIPKWMLSALGLFVPVLKENMEMLYQMENPYLFNSSKFNEKFGDMATPIRQAIKEAALSYAL
jgi:hypothetical protein